MSIAIGGLTASGKTVIDDTDCIDTSFPEFNGRLTALLTGSRS
jgi:3-phosphoshikimate 1-carboxyvinyltransferase